MKIHKGGLAAKQNHPNSLVIKSWDVDLWLSDSNNSQCRQQVCYDVG